jgi:hypothetical protein
VLVPAARPFVFVVIPAPPVARVPEMADQHEDRDCGWKINEVKKA